MLKTYPLLKTDGAKIGLVAETIPLVSLYTGDSILYGNSQTPPSNELGTVFFKQKQMIVAKVRSYFV